MGPLTFKYRHRRRRLMINAFSVDNNNSSGRIARRWPTKWPPFKAFQTQNVFATIIYLFKAWLVLPLRSCLPQVGAL